MARQTIQNANASLYFNGAAYADTSSNSTLALANGFTVAGWIKVSKFITASTRQKMIATPNWGFGATSTTQKLSFTTVGVKDYDSTGSSLQPGRWYFACGVLDSSNDVTFYLNGALDSVVTGTNPATTTAGVTSIGRRPLPTDLHIGNLSGVRVFNRELTATEILNLYNGTVPSGVIAEYLLTEGGGTVAYDTSGNGNNGTITSGTWSRDTPSKTRRSLDGIPYFNGDFETVPTFVAATTTGDGCVDGTAAGTTYSSPNKYGWQIFSWAGTYSAQFDTSERYSGTASMKLTLGATGSRIKVRRYSGTVAYSLNQERIPCNPSTEYTLKYWMKTSLSGSATSGANVTLAQYRQNGITGTGASAAGTVVKTTTGWTQYTVTLTTNATARFIQPELNLTGDDGAATLIGSAWYDDIQLYPTTPVTRSANTLARRPVDELVYNGDFEYAPAFTAATTTSARWIDGTAGGSNASDSPYRWGLITQTGTSRAQYDSTVAYMGSTSMKVSTLAANSAAEVVGIKDTTISSMRNAVPVLPNTSYTMTYYMKTGLTSGTSTLGARAAILERTGTGALALATNGTSIITTTDWTQYTITVTTGSTTRYITPRLSVTGNDGAGTLIMDAWFDNVSLKLTTPTGRSAA